MQSGIDGLSNEWKFARFLLISEKILISSHGKQIIFYDLDRIMNRNVDENGIISTHTIQSTIPRRKGYSAHGICLMEYRSNEMRNNKTKHEFSFILFGGFNNGVFNDSVTQFAVNITESTILPANNKTGAPQAFTTQFSMESIVEEKIENIKTSMNMHQHEMFSFGYNNVCIRNRKNERIILMIGSRTIYFYVFNFDRKQVQLVDHVCYVAIVMRDVKFSIYTLIEKIVQLGFGRCMQRRR